MNANKLYEMLDKMSEKERNLMDVCIFCEPSNHHDLAHEEAIYLTDNVEKLDIIHSAEIANHISDEEFSKCQSEALDSFLDERGDELDELIYAFRYHLRFFIKEKLIKKAREVGYEIPDGI